MPKTLSDVSAVWHLHAFRALFCLAVLAVVAATAGSVLAQTTRNPSIVQSELPPLSKPVVEVAAFRVAPVAESAMTARSKNFLPGDGTLPPTAAGGRKGERIIEVRAQKGESWEDLLRRIADRLSTRLPAGTAQIRQVSMPQLLPGKYLRIKVSADELMEIEYIVTPQEAYALLLSGAMPQVRPLTGDPRLIENMRADPSKASLFTATDAIGLPESIALQLTEIFAGEVDFLRELHQGYRCAVVYEANYREGFIENSGRILAAELEVGKRLYRAYYAQDAQGRGAYFDGNGKSTLRLFRRSPLEFTRVTSNFTLARFHPILGVWRAHRGVDYAAPTGTKVMSVADGIVEFVGERGGYGNLIVVRHHEKFLTYYAHLNAFTPKLAAGDKVVQGQVIGFVGMTGLATGPHLHFEFHVRSTSGEWTAVPAPDVINATLIAAPGFMRQVQSYRDSLAVAGRGNILFLE